MARLEGKVVLVTGGGHGIGRVYCERFAREAAQVVVADVDGSAADEVAHQIQAAGGQAVGLQVDVASWPAVQALVQKVKQRFGGIDALVNNAAIFATIPISRLGFEEIDEQEWDAVMAVNVKGVWLCCRAVAPAMRQRGGGSIVNISSGTVFNGSPGRVHYVASKAAVIGLTRVLSRELGVDKIRVNAVAPGSTLSEQDPDPEVLEMRQAAAAHRSLKRVQTPQDIVGAVLFLLSDEAAFITGQTLVVDGGQVLH